MSGGAVAYFAGPTVLHVAESIPGDVSSFWRGICSLSTEAHPSLIRYEYREGTTLKPWCRNCAQALLARTKVVCGI